MADHRLILSLLQPPPSPFFPCYRHRRFSFSRRFPGGSRFSVPELRLSSRLQLSNCISPSQSSSDSAPEKLDLVSSTQLNDETHVFRFGDASEVERNLVIEEKARCFEEEKQHCEIGEEVSEVTVNQVVKDGHASDTKTRSVSSSTATDSKEEERAPPANLSNVIKIKDRKRVRSTTKKKKETPNSVNVMRIKDKVEVKTDSVPDLSSVVSVVEAVPTNSTEIKVGVSRRSEPVNVEPLSSEVMEKVSVNEVRDCETSGYQQLTVNPVEVQAIPISSTSQQGSPQLYDRKEVAHVSTNELDDNLVVRENPMRTLEAEENLVVEPTATAVVSPDELLSTSEATHHIAETHVPDISEALAGREDAYFISDYNWLGIADGVSHWSFEGIIKGTYAQELMSNCQKIISNETEKITEPVQVLQKSVNETKSRGSSTALIAHLENNKLNIANIGDSGFLVIRNGTVLQKSSPMFHHFCFPLQIRQGDDVLKLAEVYHVSLEEGDVVITATDGLFDNLYETEIISIVKRSLEQRLEPQKVAESMAAKAQEVGQSETERTPFADTAKEEGYDGYKGGKLDAVTIIVSLVKTAY
ncbi:unnamed protein product [Cochlearia groenlandica]